MVLMKEKLSNIFRKEDLRFVERIHDARGRFVHAKVRGNDVSVPYGDATVFLVRRGISPDKELDTLPVKRYYGSGERSPFFPSMRLGELVEELDGKELKRNPSVYEDSRHFGTCDSLCDDDFSKTAREIPSRKKSKKSSKRKKNGKK